MSEQISSQEQLSADIHLLGDVLGRVIRQQAGIEIYDLEERMRAMAKTRRQDDDPEIDDYITTMVTEMTTGEAEEVARAFNTYFSLINLAEENHRVRVLRERERAAYPAPLKESVDAAIQSLKRDGIDDFLLQRLLNRMHIELVFTAHPTQAMRRTVLSLTRRIADQLTRREHHDLLHREEERLEETLLSEITMLWLTERSRTKKPLVTDEVKTGLAYFDTTIWNAVPELYRSVEEALARHFPKVELPARFLTYGSWIGGDRDGNPFVTAEVTAESLRLHRGLAVEHHRAVAHSLNRTLSLSSNMSPISGELASSLHRPDATEHVGFLLDRYPDEPYRIRSAILAADLAEASQGDMVSRLLGRPAGPLPRLRDQPDLLEPIDIMARSLSDSGAEAVAPTSLAPFKHQAEVFGLHTARLDLRQDSAVHTEVLTGLFQHLGIHDDYASLSPTEQVTLLTDQLDKPRPDLTGLLASAAEPDGSPPTRRVEGDLSPVVQESLNLFQVIYRAADIYGPEILGPYVISMSRSAADVLAVLLLGYWANVCMRDDGQEWIAIGPLFETRADLDSSTATMTELFGHKHYARHLERLGKSQMIMIGYSDSNKDAGYLAANWELFQAQERLADCCRSQGVMLTLFHGRGGTIARGGGPANRAIMAQPAGSIRGRIRITEQGEVIEERYGNRDIARRHLEQVVHAVLMTSSPKFEERNRPKDEWRNVMTQLADTSYRAYRDLVYETPDLITFWQQATPLAEVSQLRIGSRPARRQKAGAVTSLRAIPWGFSWMQSRYVLPGWYGVGIALEKYGSQEWGLKTLREMYQQWPFFRVVIDNAQVSLGKADMGIAKLYADLVDDQAMSDRIYNHILEAYQQTAHWILQVTGQQAILDNEKTLQRSIARRNPYVDPLNFIQISLLRRLRAIEDEESPEAQAILRAVFLTINGIAAGLKNTG